MKLNWNFQKGGEVHGGGMDIFWNCTIVRALQSVIFRRFQKFDNRKVKITNSKSFDNFHHVFRKLLEICSQRHFVVAIISLNGANIDSWYPLTFQTIFQIKYFFYLNYNFREVVRRTTVIIFANKEDYIIASNKGGDVYRFGLFLLHLLADMTLCPLDILVSWLQIILLYYC